MTTPLHTRFLAIDALLREHEALWRPQPFRAPRVPWEATHPELVGRLGGLSLEEALAIDADPVRHRALLAPWIPDVDRLAGLCELGALERRSLTAELERLGPRVRRHMSERKWAQIQAVASVVPGAPQASRWVEWCAGKGHLGRTLAALSGRPAVCLERDAALCKAGRLLAEKVAALAQEDRPGGEPGSREGHADDEPGEGYPAADGRAPGGSGGASVEMRVQDVLADGVSEALDGASHVVGLHACGHLHERLLRLAVEERVAAVSLAPCCYHVGAPEVARVEPMSSLARRRGVPLGLDDVRLSMQGHGTRSRRRLELHMAGRAWRLGYDALQREVRGVEGHARLPPVPRRLLRGSFEGFVRAVAEADGLELPDGLELGRFEAAGRARLRRVAGLELVRHLFRRPLEVWLALDRALFMAEAGYRVEVGVFCEARWTPRNLMVCAAR